MNNEFINYKNFTYIRINKNISDYFKEKGYLRLPKNAYLNKIIKIIFLKFFRKTFLIFKILFNSKVFFNEPEKKFNILFDDDLINVTKTLFTRKNYFVLNSRIENINEIYLSKKIVFFILQNFFKRSIKINYFISIIKIIKPKNIITLTDNSIDFFILNKFFSKSNINFYCIQNSHKYFSKDPSIRKKRFISNYLVFGDFEKRIYKRSKINKFIPVGSLKAEVAKIKLGKNKIDSNRYDICLISDPNISAFQDIKSQTSTDEGLALVTKYCIKFSEKFNKSIIISGKTDSNDSSKYLEEKYYEYLLDGKKINIQFNKKLHFGSYKNILQSNVIICCMSSLAREAFEFKKKVLWCQYIKGTKFPSNGICVIKKKGYEEFEKNLLKILKLNFESYVKKINNIQLTYNKKFSAIKYMQNITSNYK